MSWQNFGTSVAVAAVGIGAWLATTQLIGEMTTASPIMAAVIRILLSLLAVGLFVYVIDKVVPQFFCSSQVAVPQETPSQAGSPPAPTVPAVAAEPAASEAATPATPAK